MADATDFGAGEFEPWYRGTKLRFNWTVRHFPSWIKVFARLRDDPLRVLEIGSFEGASAVFFMNYFPRAMLTCVDAWDASVNDPDVVGQMDEAEGTTLEEKMQWAFEVFSHVEGHFDHNLAPFADRLRKIVSWSADALVDLGLHGERFDVIYVDGDHRAAGVYRDCVLAWPLLKPGGIFMMDDYEFSLLPVEHRPKAGIDAFLSTISKDSYVELERGYQLILRSAPGAHRL